jgi:putative ABC transport system permease protein
VTKYLHLVWAGLWRSRTRAVFTLLSIAVAFVLFGLLQGINAWFTGALPGARADRLIVVSRVSELELLPSGHLQKIERVAGVRRATVVGALPATYQSRGNDMVVLATDPNALFGIYPDWHTSPDALRALALRRTGVIVGAALMKAYGWKTGDRIPLLTSVAKQDGSTDWTFEIVGTYSVPDGVIQENRLIANYAYFDEARMFDKGRAFAFIVGIDDPRTSTQTCAAIDALFANSSDETITQNEAEYAQSQLRQLGDVGAMVNAIVGAVLFTLLFLTGNTMRQAVRERIPELAVLKAIGYSDGKVTALVLAESMLLCLVAALAGLAVAAAIFPVTAALGIGGGGLPLSVVVTGVLVALALALASGLPPAWQARRLPIVDALAGR